MRIRTLLLASGMAAALSATWAGYVSGAVGVNSKPLRNAVTAENIRLHLQALENIANELLNGGTRASGTPGFEASLNYVKGLVEAGEYYAVTVQPFNFEFFEEKSPPELKELSPELETFVENTHFSTMSYSGSNVVDAFVQSVGNTKIPPDNLSSSTSGCAAADFSQFIAGNIALIQRGGCTFFDKATNAAAAGASAVIIFNEGNAGDAERIPLFFGTLGQSVDIELPVLSASFAFGETLYNRITSTGPTDPAVSVQLRVKTETEFGTRSTFNLIAETKTGRNDRVVVVGAHLDSVAEGPGINDNGSGSGGILEIALQMKKMDIKPTNKVRFMWYGAEESGLLGSEHYVTNLTKRQKQNIAMMLNFDMIASPNYVRQVYDGDGSETPEAGPNGSATIEDVFNKYFSKAGPNGTPLTVEATAFDGRSDYGPFIDAGIPAGGLFTGAEDIKTPAQEQKFGGTINEALDPCYHAACDDMTNITAASMVVLEQMADAAADAVLQFAMTTSAVKGTSKANDQAVKSVDSESLLYKGSHLQR